jgi:RNA polymerase sigma-70 factor (ECF subfamily)
MGTPSEAPSIDVASLKNGTDLARAFEPYRGFLTLRAAQAIGPELAPKTGASDIVQETFLAVQEKIGTFRGSTEPEWRAWLKRILLRRLAKERRQHKTWKRQVPQPGDAVDPRINKKTVTPPSGRLRDGERDQKLAEALSQLPERYRQVVCWHHQDGLGFREIGARLGISDDAAQKAWGRALAQLKVLLGPDHDPR